jgi:hypothetical protein
VPCARAAPLDAAQDPDDPDDEAALTADIVALAIQYGGCRYRRIPAISRQAGRTATSPLP